MHIGIFSARNANYHPNRRLIEVAARLGHGASLIHPKNCLSSIFSGTPTLKGPSLNGAVDILLPRIGATINDYALALVRQFELMGLLVVNGFDGILLARNQYLSLQALAKSGIPVPDSYHISNPGNFGKAVRKLHGYPVVVKTLNSRQGAGVVRVDSSGTADFIVSGLLRSQGLLVQEFVPPANRRDIRAFVIGNRVVAAMELRPKKGDFRANIHLMGQGKPVTLPDNLAALAVRSTKALGLEISGTDIMIDSKGKARVVEVNYSPGFRGLEAHTGKDVAGEIIRYMIQMYGEAP